MSIQLDTTFPEDAVNPWRLTTATLAADIAAIPGLIAWWEALPANITLSSGAITNIAPRSGTGNMVPTSVDRRPTLATDAISGFEAIRFAIADTDSLVLSGATIDMDEDDFTLVALFKSTSTATNQCVIGRQTDSTNRIAIWHINSEQLRLTYGSTTTVSDRPCAANEWHLAIGGRSKTAGLARLRLDGATASVAAASDTGPTNDDLCVGSFNTAGGGPFGGDMALFMAFQSDLFVEGDAIDLIERYVANVYGLTW